MGAELLGQEQGELSGNFTNGGKCRFMSLYMLIAPGQWCRGDFCPVPLHHAGMVVAFCAFIPVNTDVLPTFPSFHF